MTSRHSSADQDADHERESESEADGEKAIRPAEGHLKVEQN